MKIVLIDDHPVVLSGLKEILMSMPGFDVVATGIEASELQRLVIDHKPDIAIVDLNLPGDILREIKVALATGVLTKFVVFTASDKASDCLSAMDCGALGYVLKGTDGSELMAAIRSALKNQEYISPKMTLKVARETIAERKAEKHKVDFSFREGQILDKLMLGDSNKVIAQKLSLSENTIKYYMTGIMQKLNVRSRVEVVLYLKERGQRV